MNDLNSNLNAITAQTNGNLDFSNLASTVQSDYNVISWSGVQITTLASGNYGFGPDTAGTGATAVPFNVAASVLVLDPADFALGGRTAKYRVKVSLYTNAVAPGITITAGLATATIAFGASGAQPTVTALAPIGGTAATFVTPGASAKTDATSGDFTAPAAGAVVPYVGISANMAAGSQAAAIWMLQRHTV